MSNTAYEPTGVIPANVDEALAALRKARRDAGLPD